MDMYQKRKMRADKKNGNEKSYSSTNINWYPRTYEKSDESNSTRRKTGRCNNRDIRC